MFIMLTLLTRLRFRHRLVLKSAVTALLMGCAVSAGAQTPLPTEAPTVSPTPPDPVSTPSPTDGSETSLYLPRAATVQLVSTTGGSTSAPSKRNGTSGSNSAGTSDIDQPPAQALQINSPELFSPTSLSAQPQAAGITLLYDAACAGLKVLVAPLDGGMINGSAGAKSVTVGTDGTLIFSFQAPSGPGRYHVVTRLGNSEISLPFDVPVPDNATPAP